MTVLASCPWGPVTVNGVDVLTEMYIVYGLPILTGLLTAAGEVATHGRKARKYIRMADFGQSKEERKTLEC